MASLFSTYQEDFDELEQNVRAMIKTLEQDYSATKVSQIDDQFHEMETLLHSLRLEMRSTSGNKADWEKSIVERNQKYNTLKGEYERISLLKVKI